MAVQSSSLKEKKRILDFSHLRGDIFGGVTAGIVALPYRGLAARSGLWRGCISA